MSNLHFIVIPAKAGISPVGFGGEGAMPASPGVTEFGA